MVRHTTSSMTILMARWETKLTTNDNGDGAKLLLPLMRRHLRRCRDCVVALIVMASLPSPTHRRLAIVVDDGDGVMGNDDYNDFGDRLCRRRDSVIALVAMASLPSLMRRRLAVVNDDGNGAMGGKVDGDGNGATGDDIDDDGEGTTYDDIDNDCDGTTGDEVDVDCEGTTGDEVDYNGEGATEYNGNDDDDVR